MALKTGSAWTLVCQHTCPPLRRHFSFYLPKGLLLLKLIACFDVLLYNQDALGLLHSALVFLAAGWRLGAWLNSPRAVLYCLTVYCLNVLLSGANRAFLSLRGLPQWHLAGR